MGKTSHTADNDLAFERDVIRAKFLAHYSGGWDQPARRKVFSHPDGSLLEVYQFGRDGIDKVAHVAKIGAAALLAAVGKPQCELMMVLPMDLGGATFDAVAGFLTDFALFARDEAIHLDEGYTTPDSPLIPKPWPQQAVLVDAPRGEPEQFASVELGNKTTRVWWVIPIYSRERDLIRNEGLEEFDRLDQEAELSLVDVRRPPLVR